MARESGTSNFEVVNFERRRAAFAASFWAFEVLSSEFEV
jgi:hypothetical protein